MNPDSVQERGTLSRSPACVLCVLALMSTAAAGFAQVAVKGTVVNRTTGQPAAGVALTLITFVGGMSPVEEVYSSADGAFAFQKELSRSTEQPMLGMVRAEYQGVPYSSLIRAGSAGDLTVEVYSVEEEDLPAPDRHVVIFGPEESELVVNELFFFRNESDPPLAFRNPDRGTLRFYLPPQAGGEVSVQATGPAGMPLRSTAEPASSENTYKIDFPLKPGDNRIDLAYTVPHADGDGFAGKVLYDGLKTAVVAPKGVTLEGEELQQLSMPVEEHGQMSLFDAGDAREYRVEAIRGIGQLPPPDPRASGGGGGSPPVQVAPAPIAEELIWLLALTAGILAVGFVYLYTAKLVIAPALPEKDSAPRRKSTRNRRKS